MNIGAKIMWFAILLIALAIVGEVIISNHRNTSTIQKAYDRELSSAIDYSKKFFDAHFNSIEVELQAITKDPELLAYIKSGGKTWVEPTEDEMHFAIENDLPFPEGKMVISKVSGLLPSYALLSPESNVFLLNADHEILFQKKSENIPRFFIDSHEATLSDKRRFNISQTQKINDSTFYIFSSTPILNEKNRILGRVVVRTDFNQLMKSYSDSLSLGETSEILYTYTGTSQLDDPSDSLISEIKSRVYFINKPRLSQSKLNAFFTSNNKEHPSSKLLTTEKGHGNYIDYKNDMVYAHWHKLHKYGIQAIAKIDQSEIKAAHRSLDIFTIIISVVLFIITFILATLFSKMFVSPFLKLKNVLTLVSSGALPKKIQATSNDEIGQMTETVNNLVGSLRKTAEFANKIGRGEFEADFKPVSDKDTLGIALVDMRESLQKADSQDNLRNWIVTGVAEIGEILRNNDNLESLGDAIVAYTCNRISGIQGAFYTVNDEDNENIFIEMKACYAYQRKKYQQATFKFAEGLIGQSAIEKDKILRTEVPDDYAKITSGILGEQKPSCLLIVPLITNETVYGVVEFSGLHKFTHGEVQFVEEVSEIIARTIFNIKVNERTRRLLEESQRMSSELQVQQEELRQNAVEMEATQEELKHTNQKLEHQIEEVNRAQKRMQVLLENASEVITIYEKDATIRYVSPSVENILGYNQDDLIGLSDLKFVDEKGQKGIKRMFKTLIAEPSEQVTLQFTYQRKSGDHIWLEATGRNMLADPAIQGIVLNSQDITERRRAEEEERKRGQMQALSENSLDLITRINESGNFFYINPTIKRLTGLNTDYFQNKSLDDVELNEQVIEAWKNVINKVFETNSKVSEEMDFPTEEENRIMFMNAIPEYDQDNEIESVLVVSHDITEQKAIENEIREKNKKINDSINYAERIQDAILPNNEIIKRDLPQSFIYFLPRDIVSGDFPWYQKVGDDILISAVDCTGHGVPGALISIIAFFLLQDVVDSGIHQPGEVLDALDKLVTKTLRQDEESSRLKDGMDMGFCKINTKEKTIEYAGAHRPLYIIRNNELLEFKGNKFPIGGGSAYTNKTNFTNHKIKIESGDAVYFFSDGYPDQFGGPENRKFGPKRIKEMLSTYKYDNFEEMERKVGESFQEWKGEYKQTDDVLLIGIKF